MITVVLLTHVEFLITDSPTIYEARFMCLCPRSCKGFVCLFVFIALCELLPVIGHLLCLLRVMICSSKSGSP